jgi:hypothetical protein
MFKNHGKAVVEKHESDLGRLICEVRKLKQEPGRSIVIMGGGIVSQLAMTLF